MKRQGRENNINKANISASTFSRANQSKYPILNYIKIVFLPFSLNKLADISSIYGKETVSSKVNYEAASILFTVSKACSLFLCVYHLEISIWY